MRSRFSIAFAAEDPRGQPASDLQMLATSEATISWRATLEPFAAEAARGCDRVHFVQVPAVPRALKDLARRLEQPTPDESRSATSHSG